MKIELSNTILNQVVEMFYELPLKGKQSRHRTRFINRVNTRLEEILKEQEEIIKEHCYLNEDGTPKTKIENGEEVYDVKDKVAFSQDRIELLNEKMIIEGADSKVMLLTIREILDECEVEFSGQRAFLYNSLCEEFKVDEDLPSEDEED